MLQHQRNIRVWSCLHRMYLEANLTYEVTQERGYCVARLRSLEYLEVPPVPVTPVAPRKTLARIIPFPETAYRTRVLMEEQDEIRKVFAHLALRQFPPSRTTGT